MRRQGYPYNGKRYLLNTNSNELHDLDNESSLCQIDQILYEHIKMFDYLEDGLSYQREKTGKQNGCYWCLKQYHTG